MRRTPKFHMSSRGRFWTSRGVATSSEARRSPRLEDQKPTSHDATPHALACEARPSAAALACEKTWTCRRCVFSSAARRSSWRHCTERSGSAQITSGECTVIWRLAVHERCQEQAKASVAAQLAATWSASADWYPQTHWSCNVHLCAPDGAAVPSRGWVCGSALPTPDAVARSRTQLMSVGVAVMLVCVYTRAIARPLPRRRLRLDDLSVSSLGQIGLCAGT